MIVIKVYTVTVYLCVFCMTITATEVLEIVCSAMEINMFVSVENRPQYIDNILGWMHAQLITGTMMYWEFGFQVDIAIKGSKKVAVDKVDRKHSNTLPRIHHIC